jgi:hypothetical protein
MLSPETAKLREDEPTFTMVFPQDVIVTRDDMSKVHFRMGIQEVPEHIKDHWYLRGAGVIMYTKPEPVKVPAPAAAVAQPVPLPASSAPVKAPPRASQKSGG